MLPDNFRGEMMIELNVPIPERKQYGFAKLQVGESLLKKCADTKEKKLARAAAYRVAQHKHWKIVVRSLPEGVRVWRTE
jgi:hypothetical protein